MAAEIARIFRVESLNCVEHRIYFYAGEYGIVSVISDGTTDLNINVYDPLGNLIAVDDYNWDNCYVDFFSTEAESTYTVKIFNRGDVYNHNQ